MAFLHTVPKRLAVDEAYVLSTHFPISSFTGWQFLSWETIDQNTGVQITSFAMVPGMYVCLHVDTQQIHRMVKARDILCDNYKERYGDLRSLDNVGYCDIKHADAYNAMRRAFEVMDKPKTWGKWVAIAPDEKGWEEAKDNNPFIIGVQKLLEENAAEMGNAYIEKVWFIFEAGTKGSGGSVDHDLHMRIQLGR
ncbi:hypothetical protein GGS26DRAFT_601621 [Hypomontagnella submonticulosa]|nr:hypothetical protein GGS26DRAFT_601621 [Hypomontagnella submonticulosa]